MKIIKNYNFQGWSGISSTKSSLYIPSKIDDLKKILRLAKKRRLKILPVGSQKSYFDTIYSNKNILISMKSFNKIFSYDEKNNLIEVGSGLSLTKLLNFCIKKKKIIHSIPGSPEISVGGAISNDVHGKDSFKYGGFNNQIVEIKILLSNNKLITCSPNKNKSLFEGICGGLGLIGIIVSVKIKLINLPSKTLSTKVFVCENINEQLKVFNKNEFDYMFSWIDTFSKKNKIGRGIVFASNFISSNTLLKNKNKNNFLLDKFKFYILKFIFLNNFVRTLNFFYYNYVKFIKKKVYFESFEDSVYTLQKNDLDLGKLSEPKGFLEFQIVIPKKDQIKICKEIFNLCHKLDINGILVGGKNIKKSIGYLSFCDDGFTFGVTIINNNFEEIQKKFKIIYNYCYKKKIKIYLCKDFFINKKELTKIYPRFKKFLNLKKKYDKNEIFYSDFYLRAIK